MCCYCVRYYVYIGKVSSVLESVLYVCEPPPTTHLNTTKLKFASSSNMNSSHNISFSIVSFFLLFVCVLYVILRMFIDDFVQNIFSMRLYRA